MSRWKDEQHHRTDALADLVTSCITTQQETQQQIAEVD